MHLAMAVILFFTVEAQVTPATKKIASSLEKII
jgi:hypothetical protein